MRRQSSVARYLLARFRPLGRPVFWAPSIALLLLTLFTWEFWSRPEWMSYFETSPSAIDNSMSREDQAIGAEIDSLSLLINDIGITTKARTTPANPIPQASPAPTNSAPANRSTPTNPLAINPTQPQANQGIFGVFGNALTAQLGLSNPVNASATNSQSAISQTGSLNSASTPAPLPASPLQEALTRLNAEKAQTVSNNPTPAPIEGTTRLNTPTIASQASAGIDASSQTNSFTKLVEGTQPIPRSPDFPGTIVPPIVTPSIAPTVTPVMAQPTQSFGSVAGSTEAPQVETTVPTINQQPFTVPRPIPGRYIGGGNINTFSNP